MRLIPLLLGGLSAIVTSDTLVSAKAPRTAGAPMYLGATPLPVIRHLADELDYSMVHLVGSDGTRPYYLAYTVYDEQRAVVSATLGAITRNNATHERKLNIDLRVGDHSLDNTHQLRGGGRSHAVGSGNISLALQDDADSIRHALWYHTDRIFKRAVKRLTQIKTNLKVKVEEEDRSDDFSREEPNVHFDAPAAMSLDRDSWANRLRKISAIARGFPLIHGSNVTVGSYVGMRSMVTSEGTRLQTSQTRYRITLTAGTKADDGMDLSLSFDFNAATPGRLPGDAEIETAFRRVIDQVLALRAAPLAEPYIGPAILRNRASGVFFHEIFGHRVEGHRQKDVTEGQTFTKKVNQLVLPTFISVYDDPTVARLGDIDLRGHYLYDDEGIRATRVTLVDKGVLRTFLMSRAPIEGFARSNGHGRRQPGNAVVSRQGNLIIKSTRQVPFDRLRELLIEECKRQGKPYGLLFEDISGGFTTTSRRGPQSFKVLPIVVYRIFADRRPDELIRGADIVGTPLTCFERIIHAGDDLAVFNGTCGAESGWVPVSAASPSILVSTIEIEKRTRAQSRPPILDPPLLKTSKSQQVEKSKSQNVETPKHGNAKTRGKAEAERSNFDFSTFRPSDSCDDIMMKAMADELQRGMANLALEDLPRPYFIQLNAQDRFSFSMRAAYGGLLNSDDNRLRLVSGRVRVGSYELDNTNIGRGFSGRSTLPLDDDATAIRHAIWRITDVDYKRAVETLTRKQAYLKQKNVEDRPDDFSLAVPARAVEPPAEFVFDRNALENNVKLWSAGFKKHARIQDSNVTFYAGAVTEWIVNSEGTRLRTADSGVYVEISARIQANDGMRLSDSLLYLGLQVDQLPSREKILTDIDGMCSKLVSLAKAPLLEQYTGPVLFEPRAAGKVFEALLADGLCARPRPLGSGGESDTSLEKKIGRRILPRSFQVYDDPDPQWFDGTLLAGAYHYDDEAVRPKRVTLVENGILKTLLAGRAPTRKIKKTTGHGRGRGFGDPRATIGCLYLSDDNAIRAGELKKTLIQAARDEGLVFGLRIESMETGGFGALGDPIYAYKVYVEDGREELIRGMKFLPVETRALRHLFAVGNRREVYNSTSGPPTSIIAPAIIFEELELTRIEREFDKLPILESPAQRTD